MLRNDSVRIFLLATAIGGIMRKNFITALCALQISGIAAHGGPADTVWTRLFNGTDLMEWEIKINGYALNEDPKKTFRVADNAIEVNYSNYANWTGDPFSHIGYKRAFSHYRVRLEYQFYGSQVSGAPTYANENSGIMLHSLPLSGMGLQQNWPVSLEMQFLGPNNKEGVGTGNLCTPGTAVEMPRGTFNDAHCIKTAPNTRTLAPAWTKAEAVVLGDSIVQHIIEGKVVLTYYKPMEMKGAVSGNTTPIVDRRAIKSGYILLQSESAPIRFRNIELANLKGCKDPASPNYKSYYVAPDTADCQPTPARDPEAARFRAYAFEPAASRLTLDVQGEHAVRLTDLRGEVLWSASGQGRKSYDLGGIRMEGVAFLTVFHSGKAFTQAVFLDNRRG
jgi:hypothetical protein